ncbi:oligosaccharide flippase family protein [Eubacterium limosum]|uniref:oligosaccharide flippase family protein n=1 Tax=Eubacterium limosum TaxID=1736 RepID=UPI001062D94F|nr:oligosaccharide flippase family protein [Eubacterium limosum]
MKIERTKNAARNIIFGVLLKAYQIIVPFLMRTAMIYFMGVEYLGLSSLFASILQVLNLAELGVGSAMVYSMYKPIAEDDTSIICALLKLYRTYYTAIGAVIAVIGTVLTPFIPYLIKSNLPSSLNVYVLYLLNLMATVLSYWLFSYKNALFQAHQRLDVTSKITLITVTFQYALQLAVIIIIKDYYIYVIAALLTQVSTNIITAIAATKMYGNYQPQGQLDTRTVKEINHRIRDLFTSKIGGVVVNSVDTIVISTFLGLTVLAVYQNYFYLITAVTGILSTVFFAVTAGIGNSIITETKEKNFDDLNKFTFIIAWVAGVCTCCFLCLFQPFMRLWVGSELLLEFPVVICFCIYFYVVEINQLLNTFKDAAGIWHEDRFRPLVTAIVNLGMNLIMVQFWGIYGVIFSTALSMLSVGMPWLLHNIFTVLFDKDYLVPYLKKLLFYVFAVFVAAILSYWLCSVMQLPDILLIIVRLVICCIIPNIIFLLAYHRMHEFKASMRLINKMTKEKIRFLKKFES